MIQVLFQEAFQNVDCMHYPSAQQPQHNCISSVFSDERCVWVKHLVIQKKHQKKKKKKKHQPSPDPAIPRFHPTSCFPSTPKLLRS